MLRPVPAAALLALVALVPGCAGRPDPQGDRAAVAAEPAPAPTTAATPSKPKAAAAPQPWERAAARRDGCTMSQHGWTLWFPCDDEPERRDTILLGEGTVVSSYSCEKDKTKFILSFRVCRERCGTVAEAGRAVRDHIDTELRLSDYTVKGTPQSTVVGGLPYYEVQASRGRVHHVGDSYREPSAVWHRATIENGSYSIITVRGTDPKAVFGKDGERFIRSARFTKTAVASK